MPKLEHVLYVDDEPDIRTIVDLSLRCIGGLKVSLCANGLEALVEAPKLKPDIVLLDVMMPGLDGPGTLKRLREMPELAHVPIIFMTAKVQAGEVGHFLELGAAGVIPKPFEVRELPSQVQAIWESCHVAA